MAKLILEAVLLLVVVSVVSSEVIVMQYKKNATLTCSASADAEVTFLRLHKPTQLVNGSAPLHDDQPTAIVSQQDKYIIKGNTLVIKDIRREELESEYYCRVGGGSMQPFKLVHAPALYKPDKQSQTITEGGFSSMSCKMLFGDRDDQFSAGSWSWHRENDDAPLTEIPDRFEIVSEAHTSTLTVKKVTKEDRGKYKCVLANKFGSAAEEIQLRVKDVFAALWPFLAILGEVFVLCIIILIYEKKFAKKKNAPEEETEQTQNLMGRDNADVKKRNTRS